MKKNLFLFMLFALFFTSCEESDLTPVNRVPTKLTYLENGNIAWINKFVYDDIGQILKITDQNDILKTEFIYKSDLVEEYWGNANPVKIDLDKLNRIKSIWIINSDWKRVYDYYYNDEGYLIKEEYYFLTSNNERGNLDNTIIYNYDRGNLREQFTPSKTNDQIYNEFSYHTVPNKKFGVSFECIYNPERQSIEFKSKNKGRPNTNLLSNFKQYSKNKTTGVETIIRYEEYTYELDPYGFIEIFTIKGTKNIQYVFEYTDKQFNN